MLVIKFAAKKGFNRKKPKAKLSLPTTSDAGLIFFRVCKVEGNIMKKSFQLATFDCSVI